jgi:hypothetical protein
MRCERREEDRIQETEVREENSGVRSQESGVENKTRVVVVLKSARINSEF